MQMQKNVAENKCRARSVGERFTASKCGFKNAARGSPQVTRNLPETARRWCLRAHDSTFVPAGTVAPSSIISFPPAALTFSHARASGAGPFVTEPSAAKREP